MASSSSSSSSIPFKGWTYDVFLSFRGEDTRNNFVDHLHTTLVQKGISVFKDDQMLQIGNPISSELLKAIEESKFSVVIFSKNYANSSWCLDELAKIIECGDGMGQKVLPIFYHVDPSNVRGQKGDLATAFQKHEEKFKEEMDKVNRWRKALVALGNLSGWHISPVNGGESLFIDKIVHEICSNIQPRCLEKNLIGIESRIDKLIALLGMEATHEVRMVGICGMGGIGKTTIARALFRRISYKFDGCSFVKNVRENSEKNICAVQENILIDVTEHKYRIKDPEEGADIIQSRLCNKKVFLVLDDVDDVKQLEFLAATHEWFGAGSRIIITTRDRHLLSDTDAIYEPSLLLEEHAVELFSRHAFRKNSPPDGYKQLSNRAIRCSGGLPLALKVFGSFLRGRDVSVWESALNRLAKTSNIEIFETLKISFDGLQVSEQKIFLDIACLFKGRDIDHVTKVIDTFDYDPVIGISVLIEKSLITVSNKRLDMHDLLHEMGLKIVRENYPNSRLWVREEIHDFIHKKNRKLKSIEVIIAPFNNQCDVNCLDEHDPENETFSGDVGFSPDIFENMKNLRLLETRGKFTSCEPTFVPAELRWLCWNEYPFSSLRVANMRKLVSLKMNEGKIEHLWKGQKAMPLLKYIHLNNTRCLKRFPDVSGAPNIERLILNYCVNLLEVHKSLGYLKKLAYLDMSLCFNLKCLPSLIEMPLLETIDLSCCFTLEKFPEVSSRMENLSSIYLKRCSNLKTIPSSIGKLKSLKSLNLGGCQRLKILPMELGSIENLQEVGLGSSNYRFKIEPINYHILAKLCCLKKLDLSNRQMEIIDFPNNLDLYPSLEELDLSGNDKLIELSTSISHLSRLKHLKLNDCRQLRNIQGLPSQIQVLEAVNCFRLEKIEDLTENYKWLHKIFLPGCETLLKTQQNEIFLDKMLHKDFLKKCVAGDHQLSIWIPERRIPSWFKEQQDGHQITLKLPPKWHTTIMGFTICAMHRKGFTISIVYIPFSVFCQQMRNQAKRDDWFLDDECGRSIHIYVSTYNSNVVRCGTSILYKEDMESLQQIKTCNYDILVEDRVSCYGNSYRIYFSS